MKVAFAILTTVLVVGSINGRKTPLVYTNLQERNKGTIMQFAQMVGKKSKVPVNKYLGYGNYCGLGGKGRPLDVIDKCCHQHDECIGIANRKSCLPFSYFSYYALPYTWITSKSGRIYCSRRNSSCAYAYCNCDRQCSECFAQYDRFYNNNLKKGIIG